MSTRTAHRHLERHALPCRCRVNASSNIRLVINIDKTTAEDCPVLSSRTRCRLALPSGQRSTASGSLLIARPSVCWSCERVLDRTRKEQLQQCTGVQFLCREWITILYISLPLNVRSGELDVRSIGERGRVVGRALRADRRRWPLRALQGLAAVRQSDDSLAAR